MTEIGNRLREALKALHLTQAQAAEATGVSLRSIKNYVLGNTTPDAEVLQAVCRGLDIAPNWILFGEGEMLAGESAKQGGLNAQERSELIAGYAELNQGRKDWLRVAVHVLQQLQARDKSKRLAEEIDRRGAPAALLEEIAAEKRKLESMEQEIIAAFCAVDPMNPDEPREPSDTGKVKKERRTRRLVPEQTGAKRKPQGELEAALEEYEQAWSQLLSRIGGQ